MDWLDELVYRQLRPTQSQWEAIKALAEKLSIPCKGRGCINYQLDVALQCAVKIRKNMAKKRQPEYRLQKRWEVRGFQLAGSREIINGRTFTQAHAAKIVKLGLAWKYLEVVESWNRSDSVLETPVVSKTETADETTEVSITDVTPVEGDGTEIPTTEVKVRKRRKKKASAEDTAETETTETVTE